MENLIHDMEIFEDYGENVNLVNEYNNFISQVFPKVSFKEWHTKGFWSKNYIPYSIMKSGKIIANVTAALMKIVINGNTYNSVQLGAVATLPGYREKGFAKMLMNYVMDIYKDNIDLIFLFANDSVMNFYPKYGFENFTENIFINDISIPYSNYSARKLNISNNNDYELLVNSISERCPVTKIFGAENCTWITMWHVFNVYSNNLYYLEDENAIIIKTEKENTLNIWDVISRKPLNLQSILPKLIQSNSIQSIKFNFPSDQMKFEYNRIEKDNTGLFIYGKVDFSNQLIRFPETAKT